MDDNRYLNRNNQIPKTCNWSYLLEIATGAVAVSEDALATLATELVFEDTNDDNYKVVIKNLQYQIDCHKEEIKRIQKNL